MKYIVKNALITVAHGDVRTGVANLRFALGMWIGGFSQARR